MGAGLAPSLAPGRRALQHLAHLGDARPQGRSDPHGAGHLPPLLLLPSACGAARGTGPINTSL